MSNFTTTSPSSTKVAVKIMQKELLSINEQAIVHEEISILSLLDHKHIIKHIESYDDDRYMYLVMELMNNAMEL
jgi:BR serine/threonine kinase